jgi:SAM-dependent methyltransferase
VRAVRSYYARILPFYERESLARSHLDFWRRVAVERRPRRILEIGSGVGRITLELAGIAPSFGIDVSLAMLAAAKRRARRASLRGRPRPLLVAADAHRPVFRSAFDLVLAPGDPLSHMKTIEGRKKTLRAIARQLAPEGVFVLEGLYRQRRDRISPSDDRLRGRRPVRGRDLDSGRLGTPVARPVPVCRRPPARTEPDPDRHVPRKGMESGDHPRRLPFLWPRDRGALGRLRPATAPRGVPADPGRRQTTPRSRYIPSLMPVRISQPFTG